MRVFGSNWMMPCASIREQLRGTHNRHDSVWIRFGVICFCKARHISGVFYNRVLKPAACTQERVSMLACKANPAQRTIHTRIWAGRKGSSPLRHLEDMLNSLSAILLCWHICDDLFKVV